VAAVMTATLPLSLPISLPLFCVKRFKGLFWALQCCAAPLPWFCSVDGAGLVKDSIVPKLRTIEPLVRNTYSYGCAPLIPSIP
jgi:hypothetical protein